MSTTYYSPKPSPSDFYAAEFDDNDMGTTKYGYCRNCDGGGIVSDHVDPYTGIDAGKDCPYCKGRGTRPIDTDTADAYDVRQAAKRQPVFPSGGGNVDPWANWTLPGSDHDEVPF